MNLMKLVCAIFMLYQNAFCYFFQALEEGKTDNDNDFKMSWANYCSRTILGSTKQAKWNLWDFHIFSTFFTFMY